MSVNHNARSGGIIRIYFQFSVILRYVVCTHNVPFSVRKEKKTPLIILNLQLWDFSKGLKKEFATAMVNKPLVFEPLKFYSLYCRKAAM